MQTYGNMPLFANPTVTKLPCTSEEINLNKIEEKLDNFDMKRLMDAGWVIISSWIDNPVKIPLQVGTVCVYGISFRMGRLHDRLIVNADINVEVPTNWIPNLDATSPGSKVGIVPSLLTESWLVRLCSISGYGPGTGGGPGMVPATNPIPFSVMGLDIEVSTHARKGNMPLPHDDLISITISNGGWFEDDIPDVCYCIYTFGHHTEVQFEHGSKPNFIKANTSSEACIAAYNILNSLSPDFVNVHNGFGFDLKRISVYCSRLEGIHDTFESRKLGNTSSATYWRLPNGVSFIDSMYHVDKYQRNNWSSIALGKIADDLDLPPKLDADEMMVENSDNYDVTNMLEYNSRDSDLHALVARKLKMPEMYFLLAGTARSPIWDPIGGSTGMMMFCLISSAALSKNMLLDFSKTENVDEREFEGGFVLEPETGCYKGVVVIDGNSLYGSIMSKIGIFIDRCMSSPTAHGLSVKLGLPDLVPVLERVDVDDVVEHEDLILMKSQDSYMCVKRGPVTILNAIIDGLINSRKVAKEEGDQIRAAANKLCTVSIFGSLGSRHGIISSKTCAEIVTYLGRYYVKLMMRASEECDYKVLYGDTDSIFIWVGGKTETSCMTGGSRVKRKIIELTKRTVFADVGADIKGNYQSIVISAKKKYQAVLWDGSLETKGLAMVKKDSLPIVRYCLSMVLDVLNSPFDYEKKISDLIRIVSGVMRALQNGKLPMSSQVTETKINAQPHIVYVDNNMKKRKILIGIGVKPSDVSKKWVARRIVSALDSVLIPVGVSNVSQLLFAYESKRRMKMSAT